MQFAAGVDMGLQAAEAADVLALIIDVDVLADIALFGQDAVAKREMLPPKRCQQIADSFVAAGHADFGQPVAEAFQMSTQVNFVGHNSCSFFASWRLCGKSSPAKSQRRKGKTKADQYAFMQLISGREPWIIPHFSPLSAEPNSLPFFVPK